MIATNTTRTSVLGVLLVSPAPKCTMLLAIQFLPYCKFFFLLLCPISYMLNAEHPKLLLISLIRAPELSIIFLLKDTDFSTHETPTILKQKLYWIRTDFQWYCCIGETHQEPWLLHDEKSYGITHSRENFVLVSSRLTYYKVHKPSALLPSKKDFSNFCKRENISHARTQPPS